MSTRILFVDDDPNILAAHQRNLRKQFLVDTALGPEEGLFALELRGPFAVIVADMQMPGMSGVQFLIKAQEKTPDTVRVMLTGNADQKTATAAINQGQAFRFLTKPCSPEDLALTLTASLKHYQLLTAERELLEQTLNGSVKLMTEILCAIDPQSFGRSQKLRDLVRTFVKPLAISSSWEFELAAMLASIGLVTIPPEVVQKFREGFPLTQAEKSVVERVPEIGHNLLANIPRLEPVAKIVLYQNKNYDGSGFPHDSVLGENIPIGARILRVLADLQEMQAQNSSKFSALAKMQAATGRYDGKLLESVAAFYDIYLPKTGTDHPEYKEVLFKELRVGHRLKSNILTKEGTLIVSMETEVSGMLLMKLRNFLELSGIMEPILVQEIESFSSPL